LLLSSCIIPRDKQSETICQAILDELNSKAEYLDQWTIVHKKMFGPNHSIPSGSEIHLSKLEGGRITTDTCNSVQLLGRLVVDAVENAVIERQEIAGINNNDCNTAMVMDCHHHMWNILIKACMIRLSMYLSKLMENNLSEIDWRLRVTTMFGAVLRAVDKEFSLPANYPTGHGDMVKHWLLKFHPGALLVPVQCMAGSRQDLATKGAAAVYWNRIYYVEFLNECLRGSKDNILQEN